MRQRTPSPPLITGIDGIVSRPPNEVNYSTLNGKRMEICKPPENKIRRKYRKYGISGNMAKYVKTEENTGKNGYLIEPGDKNNINTMKKEAGSNGEEGGVTGAPQRQQSENSKLNTDSITDSIYSGTSGKIENQKEPGDKTKSKRWKSM